MTSAHTESKMPRSPERESGSRGAMEDLKKDTAAVREDLSHLKRDAVRATSHATEHAMEAVSSGAESAREMYESAGKTCKQYHESMCDTVRKNPTASVLVAVGVGVLAGKLLSKL